MSGVSLDRAPTSFGYACPFCTTVIVEPPPPMVTAALLAFEQHLDGHMVAGDALLLDRATAA